MSTEHGPAATPENEPDPEAFVALFRTAASVVPGAAKYLPPVFRDSTLLLHQDHPLRIELDKLEYRRVEVWLRDERLNRNEKLNREKVAIGLMAMLVFSIVKAEIEAVNHEGEARKLLLHLKHIIELRKSALDIGDKLSADLLLVLYELFDAHFPDEDQLMRRALQRDTQSKRTGAGLREKIAAQSINSYLDELLAYWRTELIAELLKAATGKPIRPRDVWAWLNN